MSFLNIPNYTWQAPVENLADLPLNASLGDARVVLDTGELYYWDGAAWELLTGGGGGTNSFGVIQTDTGTSPAAETPNDTLTLTVAEPTDYSFGGDATTDTVTLSIQTASASQRGLLSSTDWSTFNSKQAAGNYITALTGDVTASGPGSAAATIALNAVTDAKFRQSSALSVVGRSSNSTGDVADISAGTDGFILRRSGTSLGFGLLVNANVDAAAAIDGTKISPNFGSQNIVTTGTASVASQTITGTAGAGFEAFPTQSSAPSTPASGFRLYADSTNRFSWKGANGFVRTFDGTGNTADRNYTLPNTSGTIALTSDLITSLTGAVTGSGTGAIVTTLSSGIDATKIADGSVNNTEFQYINTLSSNAQTQLDAKLNLSGGTLTGFLILNADPTNPLGAATKSYIDGLVGLNLKWKEQVRAASITNVNLATDVEDGDSFGGVTLATGDRVLIAGQTTGADNGIYVVQASGAPVRATDADGGTELELATVSVTSGTQAGKVFYQSVTPLTIGTTAQVWVVLFSTAYTASGGVVLSGNNFTLLLDGGTLTQTGSGVKVADYIASKDVSVYCVQATESLAVGDGIAYLRIPSDLNGMDLISVAAAVNTTSSSGNPTFQIARGRQSSATSAHSYVDMLSTAITIDATEYDSKDATTAPVINTSNDDVATGDLIRIDIDGIGTGTKGLIVTLAFKVP